MFLVLVSTTEHQTDFKTVEMLEIFISFKVVSETSIFGKNIFNGILN